MKDFTQLVTYENAIHYCIFPKAKEGDLLEIYCPDDIENTQFSSELGFILGYTIKLNPVPRSKIKALINEHYKINRESSFSSVYKNTEIEVDQIIEDALRNKSSDIHIERNQLDCRIRIRIDGVLIERNRLDIERYYLLINKIKVRSNLNIAEKRIPQDGRMNIQIDDFELYVRVSIIPTFYGEKIVLRLLGMNAENTSIDDIGMDQEQLELYKKYISKKQGLVLISGPTGSGKTTTLYATLRELNQIDKNITTVEDPIEYILQGLNQVQIKPEIHFDFSAALRSILRQDPDIIMIGEIRDSETAQIAIRASLTGHLVFATKIQVGTTKKGFRRIQYVSQALS